MSNAWEFTLAVPVYLCRFHVSPHVVTWQLFESRPLQRNLWRLQFILLIFPLMQFFFMVTWYSLLLLNFCKYKGYSFHIEIMRNQLLRTLKLIFCFLICAFHPNLVKHWMNCTRYLIVVSASSNCSESWLLILNFYEHGY